MALAVAAIALLVHGGSEAPQRVLVDERSGSVAGVRLGDSRADVLGALGPPTDDEDGFFPAERDFTGPPAIPTPEGRAEPIHYKDVAFLVSAVSGVFAVAVLAEGGMTRAGVGIGDSLDRVRERYRGVMCGEAIAGEALVGPDPTYEWCSTTLDDVHVFFGGDPIASITLRRAR
jgi:hypothetical protein